MDRNIDVQNFMKPTTQAETTHTDSSSSIDVDTFIKPVVDSISVEEENAETTENVANTAANTVSDMKDRGDGSVDVIQFKNLTQIFNKGTDKEYKLFENFNLNIPDIPNQGQMVSIMGGSGCGKSRLVRVLCGLDDVQEGEILVYGKLLKEYKNIPMCFQSYSNYAWRTCLENVMLPMIVRGVSKSDAEKRAIELLDIVGMKDKANNYPAKLSGGQNQRISIARSLACDSQIVVFDEATGALDIKMKREVQNIILKIFYDTALDPTIINITHSVEEALYLSNKIIILQPNPCTVYKSMDVHYPGEDVKPRGEWIFDTPEYAHYLKELTNTMNEVCK